MSDGGTVIIAGAGPSTEAYGWPLDGIPIMAVSSGILRVPECEMFATLDKPMCYPNWVQHTDTFDKHVPSPGFSQWWGQHPRVRLWEYGEGHTPNFIEGQINGGPLPRNNSLFFAVQVAGQLGYTRHLFMGVDLLGPEYLPICDVMRAWYPLAREAGIEWLNMSEVSQLVEFMPLSKERRLVL